MALKAKFKLTDIRKKTEDFYNRALAGALEALKDAAQQVVNEAKLQETYADQTGNLRASIGYVIFFNGEKVAGSFASGTGQEKGKAFSETVAKKYSKGFVVVLVAGMEYAAYVEAKGYDVLTGSSFMFSPFFMQNMKVLQDSSGIKFEPVKL